MTQDRKRDQAPVHLLADLLAEDILAASDAEILAEMREDGKDPQQVAAAMRGLFEKSVLLSNKGRLAAAKAAVASERQSRGAPHVVDIADARRRLRDVLERQDLPQPLTLAARKESELSDADVLGLLQDIKDLGILPSDESDGR